MSDPKERPILPTQPDPPPPPDMVPEDPTPTDPDVPVVPTAPDDQADSKRRPRPPMQSRPDDFHDTLIIDRRDTAPRAQMMSWGPFHGCAVTR